MNMIELLQLAVNYPGSLWQFFLVFSDNEPLNKVLGMQNSLIKSADPKYLEYEESKENLFLI